MILELNTQLPPEQQIKQVVEQLNRSKPAAASGGGEGAQGLQGPPGPPGEDAPVDGVIADLYIDAIIV